MSTCQFSIRIMICLGFVAPALSVAAERAVGVLRIGSTGTITGDPNSPKEKAGLETLRGFIKEETGFANEITGQQRWDTLADKLASGQLQLGVFQGYEFAWAQQKNPGLKPLAVGVNGYSYPVACLYTQRQNPAKDFAGLKGQSCVFPSSNQGFLPLFVERSCQALGASPETFFSKRTAAENAEDALDDLVDGNAQVVVIDRGTADAYKSRKPGRFAQLKEVAHSQPFPPVVVAFYDGVLDKSSLTKFKGGLLNAANKEKGEMLLTLSHLTAFDAVPSDFSRVLAETVKAYPPTGK